MICQLFHPLNCLWVITWVICNKGVMYKPEEVVFIICGTGMHLKSKLNCHLFPFASFLVLKCEIIYITGYTIATCIQAKYCANYVTTFTNIWLMDYIRGVCKTELLYLERCYTPPYKWVMHEHTDTFVFFRHLTTAVYTLSTPNLGKRETENILQLFFVDVDIKLREVCKLHTIWMCMQNNQTSL